MIKRKFKIGDSNFRDLVERRQDGEFKNHFVDKTLFIQQVLENQGKVLLITRPRRFGKSTNLNMLKYFFSTDLAAATKDLFRGLKIEQAKLEEGQACMDYQGQYPVISLSFKDLKQENMEDFQIRFKYVIKRLYGDFSYLRESNILSEADKQITQSFIDHKADWGEYEGALQGLIDFLYQHHGSRKVIVLIDEYDVPFQNALHLRDYAKTAEERSQGEKYLENLRKFFGIFLGAALKDNDQLEKCVMTGIVRLAGAGIFSDLNNLDVFTVLDAPFRDSFGFTEAELINLLTECDKKNELEEYRRWYNGYQFSGQTIYNPWSVIKALSADKFAAYWLGTSNNDLIRSMLCNPKSPEDARKINSTVAELVAGFEVEKQIDAQLIFDNRTQSLEHLWILLISAGYLHVVKFTRNPQDGSLLCTLAIPNIEVKSLYSTVFLDWLREKGQLQNSSAMIEHLLKGEAEQFCQALQKIFLNVVSSRDAPHSKNEEDSTRYEAFYHGFMVALLALSQGKNQQEAMLKSNRESGHGFYDLVLEPKDNSGSYSKGVIFEFKRAESEQKLKEEAKTALNQIKKKKYIADMANRGVGEIVCIGMAFYQKKLQWKIEFYNREKGIYLPAQASASPSSKIGATTAVVKSSGKTTSSTDLRVDSPLPVNLTTSASRAPAKGKQIPTAGEPSSLTSQRQVEGSRSTNPPTLDMSARKKEKQTVADPSKSELNDDDDFEEDPPRKETSKKIQPGKTARQKSPPTLFMPLQTGKKRKDAENPKPEGEAELNEDDIFETPSPRKKTKRGGFS